MLRLIGLVVSIGIADSLNPTTIAPALYLASGERARERVTEFTLAVFLVSLAGGAVIALGPGELLLDVVPTPHHVARHIVEIVAGVVMLIVAALVWHNRNSLSDREPPQANAEGKSSAILGATIAAVELPTAFPYFAAIAAIVGSGLNIGSQLLLLVLFNVCFILPLLLIVATLWIAGERATQILDGWREFLQRHWPVVVAGLALLAGVIAIAIGVTGLLVKGHGRVGRLARRLRLLFHLSPNP